MRINYNDVLMHFCYSYIVQIVSQMHLNIIVCLCISHMYDDVFYYSTGNCIGHLDGS